MGYLIVLGGSRCREKWGWGEERGGRGLKNTERGFEPLKVQNQ